MTREKILDTTKAWAEVKREPGDADICYGPKYENQSRGHVHFISSTCGMTIPVYKRVAKGIDNCVVGQNILMIDGHIFTF